MSLEWELSYMSSASFSRRLFALRPEKQELRVNPRMRIKDMRLGLDCGIAAAAIPVVRDHRLPPYVCVLINLETGHRDVMVSPPNPASLIAD